MSSVTSGYLGDRESIVSNTKMLAMIEAGERLTLKTGLCSAGFHEGSKPTLRDGTPVKTCPQYQTCPCKCHTDLDELFAMSDRPRELVINPDYVPVKSEHFLRPTVMAAGLLSGEDDDPEAVVSPAPGIVPGETRKTFEDTPSGRWARGQLEYFVKHAIDVWVIEARATGIPEDRRAPCTPAWISEQIADMQAVAPPPLGGINSVLDRWVKQEICTVAQKPFRFVAYTPEVIEVGIDRMRDQSKREKKLTKSMSF